MTTMKLSEGQKPGEGLEMRKVNYKFPAGGVEVGLGGREESWGFLCQTSHLLLVEKKASMLKSTLGLNRTGQATSERVAEWER